MCGLAGFLGGNGSYDLNATVVRMSASIIHRGPDDCGVWLDDSEGIALAHRRLSIVDLSPAGHQPMQSSCGRYVIVYNGEIYNHLALRQTLDSERIVWRGRSDTETLLVAISLWGLEEALKQCVGMFAFALWDKHARNLSLARDRLGEKPLYYGWQGQSFLFASELKALRSHPECKGEIDRNALALYMRHNYVPGPHSIYKGIQKLPPGTCLTVGKNDRAAQPQAYWSAREAAIAGQLHPYTGPEDEARATLDHLLRQSVAGQMVADVPLGAFLSGGVDSSTVVALMQAQSVQPVRTFTIGFREAQFNEARHARAVAEHLGTRHTELFVTPEEARAVIPRLPALYDEPFADSSQIPTFLVSELARHHVTVSLSGDGGDELFGGYNRYSWTTEIWRRIGKAPAALRQVIARALTGLSPSAWDSVIQTAGGLLPSHWPHANAGDKLHKLAEIVTVPKQEQLYLALVSHWKEPAELVLAAAEPPTVLIDPSHWTEWPDAESSMMYLDQVSYLPDDILTKVDRAAMAVSLETRMPMLDHRIVEFAWTLPLSMKIKNHQGKWLLRQVLQQYVPLPLIERPKMGFGVPLDAWLRGPLRPWAEALLNESRINGEGYLNPAPIRRKWIEHLAGRRNWAYHLWDVLMFQAWLEART